MPDQVRRRRQDVEEQSIRQDIVRSPLHAFDKAREELILLILSTSRPISNHDCPRISDLEIHAKAFEEKIQASLKRFLLLLFRSPGVPANNDRFGTVSRGSLQDLPITLLARFMQVVVDP